MNIKENMDKKKEISIEYKAFIMLSPSSDEQEDRKKIT